MTIEAMKLALEALEISIDYLNECLEAHDAKYLRHPATEAERNNIVEDAKKVAANLTSLRQAIEQAQKQEPVAFLANGTRFKISYDSRQSGGQIHGIPPELGGRWVAFVAADDDCHLRFTTPPQRQPEQEPVQCWKCGDMDAEFQAKCNVPACGIKGEA